MRPGVIRTPMTEGVADKYEQRIADGLVPMKRWGYPEDVAPLAAGSGIAFATGASSSTAAPFLSSDTG